MKKALKVSTTTNMVKASIRLEFISQGGNDGRFNGSKRAMPDKKKEAKKNGWC